MTPHSIIKSVKKVKNSVNRTWKLFGSRLRDNLSLACGLPFHRSSLAREITYTKWEETYRKRKAQWIISCFNFFEGQKGIGFKSVFRITDTPEIHSNGYHIKFDAKCGPAGLILPHWCTTVADNGKSKVWNDWTTRIVLPIKSTMKDAQKRTLIARFHDIQPSLLLFLRRLRQIKIYDEVINHVVRWYNVVIWKSGLLLQFAHPSGWEELFFKEPLILRC